jgi:hypothetical protein
VFWAVLNCPVIPAANDLYVVSGCPAVTGSANGLPAVLYAVNQQDLTLTVVRQIIEEGKGVGFILENQELRKLVAGSPHYAPSHFEVVNMDSPGARQAFDVTRPGLNSLFWHFFAPDSGPPYFGLYFVNYETKPHKQEWVGVRLNSFEQSKLNAEVYRDVLVSGGHPSS